MADYHNNNSINNPKSTQPPEPAKPVIPAGSAKVRKKNFLQQMWDDLVVSDLPTIKQTVKNNILIPGIRKLGYDIVLGIAAGVFYNGRGNGTSQNFQTFSNPSFNAPRGQGYWGNQPYQQPMATQSANLYNPIDFIDAGVAQEVLDNMKYRVQTYGNVRVSDMFSLAGLELPNNNYILQRWGWTDLSTATIMPVSNGCFHIILPNAIYFN